MAEVFFRHLSRWQAEQQQETLADEFVETFDDAPGAEYPDRQGFLTAFNRAFPRAGFDLVVAGTGGRTAGHAYGYLVERPGDWWRALDRDAPLDLEELAVEGKVFALAELTVLPHHRRMGVAGRLIEHLAARTGAALMVARVAPGNTAARAAFASWGWTRLGTTAADDTALPSVGAGSATEVWGRVLRQ